MGSSRLKQKQKKTKTTHKKKKNKTKRPILLAVAGTEDAIEGMRHVLRVVVRRVVVGNLGTGNVERRFGEAARNVFERKSWEPLKDELSDLNPTKDEFVEQLTKRSFNKGALSFFRRSILAKNIAPESSGVLHLIWPRQGPLWTGMDEEQAAFWAATIGNTFLSNLERRPRGANDWNGFKEVMLPTGIAGEWIEALEATVEWNAVSIEAFGTKLARSAGEVWFS